jgi:hypothetical protein
MRRATASISPPANCIGLRDSYSSLESFNQYKAQNLDTSTLGTYTNATAQNVTALQIMENNVNNIMLCIQKELIQRQDYTSQIYTLQQTLEKKKQDAKKKAGIAKEARERAELVTNPYEKTTVWESWFPLGRPLQPNSVPVLLSFAILFLTLSLGMFLHLAAVDFELKVPFLAPQIGGRLSKG